METLLEGFAQDRLLLPVCQSCNRPHLYPRPRCPHCGGDRFGWQEAQGAGMVTSFTTVHRAPSPAFADHVPYTIVTVRLAEGPQIMGWILEAAPDAVRVGMPVTLRFATLPGSERRPAFAPAERVP